MKLLTDAWVPTINEGKITLEEALKRPLSDIQTGRPDFDFSIYLIAIGLEKTGYNPPPVFGIGERFLQRQGDIGVTEQPITRLVIGDPGENAERKNTDSTENTYQWLSVL